MATSSSNSRGEMWVVVQFVLLFAILLAPFIVRGETWIHPVGWIPGVIIGGIGAVFVLVSATNLGSSLTAFPRPVEHGKLTQHGIYGIVRHPMYCGVLLLSLGFSLFVLNPVSLILTAVLALFFDRKAAREEIWLAEKYPDYPAYKQRVKKLIPFVY
jgi:protein-S-isoprenylcysteine O-methyltransferase Ste14